MRLATTSHVRVAIREDERDAIASLAARLVRDEPALANGTAFGPAVAAGIGDGPTLVVEDHSEIALMTSGDVLAYADRALMLAGDGDLVVLARRHDAFQAYCRDMLGLGEPEVMVPAGAIPHGSLALACLEDDALIGRIVARARKAGGLTLLPYMGIGRIWRLAGRLGERAGVAVRVAAPPPELCRLVNDKQWFAERVGELLGASALPAEHPVFGPRGLAAMLRYMAARHAVVGVKLRDSASALGNRIVSAEAIAAETPERLVARLLDSFHERGWEDTYPLVVTAWEQGLLSSPSVQLWIPPLGGCEVVVEGVFDQLLAGERGAFAGAEACRQPKHVGQRLGHEAALLGLLLQRLGYVGRCSLDAVVVRSAGPQAAVHWIECNGRWGGVSIPMTLANRLVGDWSRGGMVIVARHESRGGGTPFHEVLAALRDQLFTAGGDGRGGILLCPDPIERGEGFEAVVLDDDREKTGARAGRFADALERMREPG